MIEMESKNPMDYVRVALAIETLAYHNRSYLCSEISYNECKFSEQIQYLLKESIKKSL